jgi:hypothetical protein
MTYNNLSVCFSVLGNKVSAIMCLMQAILIDYESLASYLSQSGFSQLSSIYRSMINSFMEKLKAANPQNVLIKFNIALYYY